MKKFIGDKKFYKLLFLVVIPIILQQFITQFVGLLDNLMIGQVGNDEMVGVSLANQLFFVFNLGVFGCLSGASIFATQYFGAKNKEGYQETIRFKWLCGIIIFVVALIILLFFNEPLINFFINGKEGEFSSPARVLESGKNYLLIMLFGIAPFIIKEIYASSLREMKETLFPMISGVIAIAVNLILNYLLIFGKLGFPELGCEGAAIATVISRVVEMLLVIIYAHVKKSRFSFLIGLYSRLIVKKESIKHFFPKTLLLVSNEVFWSLGLTFILSSYSLRGLDIVAAFNISNTVNNLFVTLGTSLGNATAIILGNMLGANKIAEAKDASYKILFFSGIVAFVFSAIMIGSAYLIPNVYKTSDEIRYMARTLIIIGALFLPFQAFNTCCYFTLRTGGKIFLTILFDSLFIWTIRLPLAFILSKYTTFSIYTVFMLVDLTEAIKAIAGYILVDKGIWLKQII